jgi:hypothetical protein
MTYLAQKSQQKQLSEAQWKSECFKIIGTSNIYQIKNWCGKRRLKASTWKDLCNKIYRKMMFPLVAETPSAICCIQMAMEEESRLAEKICDLLGIKIKDMSLYHDNAAIPEDCPAYKIEMRNGNIYDIFYWNKRYHSEKSEVYGNSDPYSAALELVPVESILMATKEIQDEKLEQQLELHKDCMKNGQGLVDFEYN